MDESEEQPPYLSYAWMKAEFDEIVDSQLVEVEEAMDDYYIAWWLRRKYRGGL